MLATTANARQLFEESVSQRFWQLLWQLIRGSRKELLTLPKMESSIEDKPRESRVALEQII
jgi:hypothetical protein